MELRPNHQFDPFGPDAAAYDSDDINLDDIDFNDPSSFVKVLGGGPGTSLPIPEYMSPADVRRETKGRSGKIFDSYNLLHEILERHEATIQKRWTKKTKQQRLKILLSSWPDMPTVHRPDFDAFRKESEQERDMGTKYRARFMWPYINQQDLLKPNTLPLLLNARGRLPPAHFAGADYEAIHLGLVTKAIVPMFLNEYTMVLNAMGNTRDYFTLLSWNDHPDAFNWMVTRKHFMPGEGLVILEIQERLLAFLVGCCQELLHDIPAATLTSDTFSIQPAPQLKAVSESSGFESLAVMAAEAPYRPPAQLDLARIESLLAAKTSAAADHLWALREDPSYFTEQLLEAKEHRQEMLKDITGKAHPVWKAGREGIFWARVTGGIVVEAYFKLEIFSELLQQAQDLQALNAKYEADISPSKDLPEEYLGALLKFRFYLNQAAKGPLNQLRHAVASPPMRKFFVRDPPEDANTSKIVTISKPGIKMNNIEEQLTWLLRTLWEDDKPLFFASMPLVTDELERLIQAEPQAQALISSYIAGVIGDLSIVSQCVKQLEIYQPWARSFDSAFDSDWKDTIEKDFAKRSKPWTRVNDAMHERHLTKAARLGEPSDRKFAYPFEKRRTRETVEALRQAERNLDALWAEVDRVIHAKAGSLDGMAVRHLLSQPRLLQRTPEWVEPPAPAAAERQKRAPESNVDSLNKPLSALYFGLGGDTSKESGDSSNRARQPKTKIKTRGTPRPQPTSTDEAAAIPEENSADPQPTFAVDARAFKVFRTLFFNPAVTSTPGEIPWSDFLHAMTSTGFMVEKLYGSAWQFRPTKLDVDKSIQFHEPHPRSKIPFTVARRLGRRLNRAYGWSGGMFVLKEK